MGHQLQQIVICPGLPTESVGEWWGIQTKLLLVSSCKRYVLHSAKMLNCISCQSWNFWANCSYFLLFFFFFYFSTPWLCNREKDV